MYWVNYINSYIREEGILKWGTTTIKDLQKTSGQIDRYICGKTNLLKVSFLSIFYYNCIFH